LVLLSISSFANTDVVCTLKTGSGSIVSRVDTVKHEIVDNPHSLTNFSTDLIKGHIGVSNGYLVVNTIDLETNQVISFYGSIQDGKVVGGNRFSKDNEFWTQIFCK
jgi:hypothetical protein